VLDQDEAVEAMSVDAAHMSLSMLNIFKARFGRHIPGVNWEPLRPTQIQPVYLPTWIIDAEVNAMVHGISGTDSGPVRMITQPLIA
jgi:hypothetical protein